MEMSRVSFKVFAMISMISHTSPPISATTVGVIYFIPVAENGGLNVRSTDKRADIV